MMWGYLSQPVGPFTALDCMEIVAGLCVAVVVLLLIRRWWP